MLPGMPTAALRRSAPGAPSVDLQAASDSGASSTDNITTQRLPIFDINLPSGVGAARDAHAGDVVLLQIFAASDVGPGTLLAGV